MEFSNNDSISFSLSVKGIENKPISSSLQEEEEEENY